MIPAGLIEDAEAERVLPHLRVRDLLALLNYTVILIHGLKRAGMLEEATDVESVLRSILGRGR
jgi:hypothetical protein